MADSSTTTLLFKEPPPLPEDESGAPPPRETPTGRGSRSNSSQSRRDGGGSLRMLKGARQAASGMKLTDDQIRAVLDDPQKVAPDPKQPHRTRLTRDGITVTTGQDGMILRVTKRR